MLDNFIKKIKGYLPKPENSGWIDLRKAIKDGEIREGYLIRIIYRDGRNEHIVYAGCENNMPYFHGDSQKLEVDEIIGWEVL